MNSARQEIAAHFLLALPPHTPNAAPLQIH